MDPTTGITATLFVSVLPFGDPVPGRLFKELEAVIYGELLSEC